MKELFELIFQRQVKVIYFQDNTAIIQIIVSGYLPKLRYLNKICRINISSIHEAFNEGDDLKLLCIKTLLQRADPFTKPLPVAQWEHTLKILNISKI